MTETRYWLGRARGIDREIETLLRSIQETRDRLMKITQNYSSDGAQSTKDPHKFDKLVELENQVEQKISELLDAKKEIGERISLLPDPRERAVLLSYYVRGKTLEEIAVENHYSYRQTLRYKKAGISALEKLSHNVT